MNTAKNMEGEKVKENVVESGVGTRWVALAALCSAATLLVAGAFDAALPAPLDRSAPPDRFIAQNAYEHLVNLTSIGPRVAGSYENEVAAVKVLLEAARGVQAAASPHNHVEIDVFSASGAFALTFIDGMTNMYRDVQSVAIRVRGAGGRAPGARKPDALLLNCHYDTVPDSPGASDDGAGCAVVLETLRALAAAPRPLRHDVVALLNGAEENILQASHAFVTTHRWAKSLRVFINIEACGAGGREVLFQAGPHDPWLLEVYAGQVPHPFASSLAQELFESGLIPADTDFRIFRDFGNISGVDLAWSSNGYVYHTRLDTAARVPPAALQRTGDNVLALAHGLLSSERLEQAAEHARLPVFFDVLGVLVLLVRAPLAALAALGALALVAASVLADARDARKHLYLPAAQWARVVARALLSLALAQGAGLAASAAVALSLHAAGAPVCASWWDARRTWARAVRRGGAAALARGAWAARAWRSALGVGAAGALGAGALLGLRSAFLPALWALAAGAGGLGAGRGAAACWPAAAALPAAQTAYLALGCVNMFAPVMGRAGTTLVPPDVIMALIVASLTLTVFSWMLPIVITAKNPRPLMYAGWAATLAAWAACAAARAPPYSAARPQRVMLFHTRRSVHAPHNPGDPAHHDFYWLPELDANTPHSLDPYVAGMREAAATSAAECARWVYCGAPYYLPVSSLVARGHALPAPGPPPVRLHLAARLLPAPPSAPPDARLERRELILDISGPNHIVVILAPAAGGEVTRCRAEGAGAGVPTDGAIVRPHLKQQ
ncbi:endoplasmic reticulum metallopeptidase 1-like [Zerene cesonia]|uniref:endoplasmic reticulum metallopeptidase 1-like n=1 Tax=Zerene cesonia TaxID=33412 RepID=UPI0018E5983C|nr:endoplasmic reticulum metallopeptidase 1-like [Zerene cesonia]